MSRTLDKLKTYMQDHGPNEIRVNRLTAFAIPDVLDKGLAQMLTGDMHSEEGTDEVEPQVEVDDLGVE